MHHRVADLDTRGPAAEHDPARLQLEAGKELANIVVVGFVGVHGRGELPFDVLGHRPHFRGVGAPDDQAGRTEYLGLQRLGLQEAVHIGAEQCSATGGLVVTGFAADDQVGFAAELGDAVGERIGDAGGEHRRCRRFRERVARRDDEGV